MHDRGHTARSAPDDAHAHGGMHHEACVAWQTIKKYIDLLQSVANRRERVVEIELDDVFNYFGGDEMAEKIRRNTYRYKQLICQAIDRCSSAQKPHPQPRAQPRARARAHSPTAPQPDWYFIFWGPDIGVETRFCDSTPMSAPKTRTFPILHLCPECR